MLVLTHLLLLYLNSWFLFSGFMFSVSKLFRAGQLVMGLYILSWGISWSLVLPAIPVIMLLSLLGIWRLLSIPKIDMESFRSKSVGWVGLVFFWGFFCVWFFVCFTCIFFVLDLDFFGDFLATEKESCICMSWDRNWKLLSD